MMNRCTEIDDTVVINEEWIDLDKLTGRAVRTFRKKYRDPYDDRYFHVNTYNYIIGDLACDPRSGGIAGLEKIAPYYGVGVQQFRKNIMPTLNYIKEFGGAPATNTSSAEADGLRYQREMYEQRCTRLGVQPIDCSSGSIYE